MSLLVWIPGTKDFADNGFYETEWVNDNVVIANSGKIGKCLSFNGSTARLSAVGFNLGNTWSFATWVKCEEVNAWGAVFTLGYSNDSNVQTGLFIQSSQKKLQVSWNGKYVASISLTEPTEWNHIAATFNGVTLIVYINGSAVYTKNNITDPYLERNTLTIGAEATNATTGWHTSIRIPFKGFVNDFRLYDHALSPKEIQLISRGLIIHYPLNREGFGGDNLLKNSQSIQLSGSDFKTNSTRTFDTETKIGKIEVVSTSARWNAWVFLQSYLGGEAKVKEMTTGTNTYTVSMDVRVTNYTSGQVVFGFDFRDTSVSVFKNYTLSDDELDGNWHRVFVTLTTNDSQNSKCLMSLDCPSSGVHGSHTIIEYKNPKIEVGDVATPWVPNSADDAYAAMGMDDNIVYDASGYGNNGIITGTLSYTGGGPRNNTATYFDGSSYISTAAGTFNWFDFDKCTVSAWMNPGTKPSGYSGAIGISHDGAAANKCFSIANHGGNLVAYYNNGNYSNVSSGVALPIGEWHHCAATLDGTTVKIYVDGELKKTQTIDWGSATVSTGNRVQIGVDFPGSDEKYTGSYSDVRIYSTVLSDDDILGLYQAPISLSSIGSLLTQGELSEV